MSQSTIQAIVPVQSSSGQKLPTQDPHVSQLGSEVLDLLAEGAYWLLLQDADPCLVSLYSLTPGSGDCVEVGCEQLSEFEPLQKAARHLLLVLRQHLEDLGPVWVLLSTQPCGVSSPPCARTGDMPTAPWLNSLNAEWLSLATARKEEPSPGQDDLRTLIEIDAISIELGKDLVPLATARPSRLLTRLGHVRRHLALELGLPLAGVRVRDNRNLGPREYRLLIREVPLTGGTLRPDKALSVGPEAKLELLAGPKVVDPCYGMPGRWIEHWLESFAAKAGCYVLDCVSVVAIHLTNLIRQWSPDLLTYPLALNLLEGPEMGVLRTALERRGVDDVAVWMVWQELLRERVSIRDRLTVLQSLLREPSVDQAERVEVARRSLSVQICRQLESGGLLRVARLTQDQEALLEDSRPSDLLPAMAALVPAFNGPPVYVCRPELRRRLRDLGHSLLTEAHFLSTRELAGAQQVEELTWPER